MKYGRFESGGQGSGPPIFDSNAEDDALFGIMRDGRIRDRWIKNVALDWFFAGLNRDIVERLQRLYDRDELHPATEVRIGDTPVTLQEALGKVGARVVITIPALRRQLLDDGEEPGPIMRKVERILAEGCTPGDGVFARLDDLARRRRLLMVADELARRAGDQYDDLDGLRDLVGVVR